MNAKEANKITAAVWAPLAYRLNNKSWSRYADAYLAENVAEEKAHRGNSIQPRGLTVNEAARLFAVRMLAQLATGNAKAPHVKYFLSMRRSLWTAAALWLNYRKDIRAAFKDAKINPAEIAALDYAELIKV